MATREQYVRDRWQNGFDHLFEYVKTYGTANVPKKHVSPDNYRLGKWVFRQRDLYYAHRLNDEFVQKLRSVGFMFERGKSAQVFEDKQWEKGFSHLLDYMQEHGDTLVPLDYRCEDGYWLGSWARNQRAHYKSGYLRPNRKDKLVSIGFVFSLKDYYQNLSDEDRKTQRKVYRKKNSPITKNDERHYHAEVPWSVVLRHLEEFYDEYGICYVPRYHRSPDGRCLGRWCFKLLQKYNRLPLYKIEDLERLGFIWIGRKKRNG